MIPKEIVQEILKLSPSQETSGLLESINNVSEDTVLDIYHFLMTLLGDDEGAFIKQKDHIKEKYIGIYKSVVYNKSQIKQFLLDTEQEIVETKNKK